MYSGEAGGGGLSGEHTAMDISQSESVGPGFLTAEVSMRKTMGDMIRL